MSIRDFFTKGVEQQFSGSVPERNRVRAFTLIETIVTIAATAVIMLALGSMLTYFYKTNAYTLEQSRAIEEARKGVEDSMKNLREASYASDGSYPIATAATSSISFYSNVNGDNSVERVTYWLSSGVLYRGVVAPAGNPLSYVGQATTTSTIASNITNATAVPIFQYYDDTGALLTSPIDISAIASVKTTVVVDVNINRAPIAFTLSAGATLRNLKDQR